MPKSTVAPFITTLSEWLRKILPTRNFDTRADTPIVQTSTPISLLLDQHRSPHTSQTKSEAEEEPGDHADLSRVLNIGKTDGSNDDDIMSFSKWQTAIDVRMK